MVGAIACAQALSDAPETDDEDALAPGFRIDPVRAGGCDLFRLAEDRRLLVVSDRVAQRLDAADLRGLVLQDPTTYTGRRISTASGTRGPDAGG